MRRDDVVRAFLDRGNRRAARIVEAMPALDGFLDAGFVDRLLVAVHCELQRVAEEFQHGQRVAELLRPLLAALRETGAPRPLRVVDVGCGTGFAIRWLAARGDLGADVELQGVDFNGALVAEASRLAAAERLEARFMVAHAFRLADPGTVYLSTGVVHHFRGEALVDLFRQHERPPTRAFAHFDFQPSPLAALGSWLFHAARMRAPLARHDGVLSAIRAHSGATLIEAARRGAPGFRSGLFGTRLGPFPIPRSFHTLLGVRPEHHAAFVRQLGGRASRLGPLR